MDKAKVVDQRMIEAAKKIWDYLHMNGTPEKSDCILVLGSHDLRVAERGAELFLEGYAPYVVFSGGYGRLTEGVFDEPEGEKFARVAIAMGVPAERIIVENKATNTGENVRFSHKLLKQKVVAANKLILVQKPYMERRTYATFKKQWPDDSAEFSVTSPKIPFEEYTNEEIPLDHLINIMVGDLQRIKEYPDRGFQVYQEIPVDVWEAYELLVSEGFTSHLME